MATIGLDKLYYATITENPTTGEETYASPKPLAKAISAELSVEVAEAILYADDGPSEIVKEFKSGTLTLGVDDLGTEAAAALTGAILDANGVLISSSEDGGTPVAIGFRAARSNGTFQCFWLYRVKFALPSTTLDHVFHPEHRRHHPASQQARCEGPSPVESRSHRRRPQGQGRDHHRLVPVRLRARRHQPRQVKEPAHDKYINA